ncbi:hypothetical protein C1645_741550 [Glomus cerebriforme]|uniref:Uncharacterized protein n=1 Tax=Glomus cerebriforme TaxID=658196 RepID=A0A397SRL2_9GLOM|nr:hypothetical protein C1645_741550 [Glomus cerebriforme]
MRNDIQELQLHATLDDTLKEMKKLGTGVNFQEISSKSDQGPFPSDIKGKGKAEPNADIRKHISMRPPDCTVQPKNFIFKFRQILQQILKENRNTAIQSIFDAGNEEIEAMTISGHNSSAGVRNYLKVTKEKKNP